MIRKDLYYFKEGKLELSMLDEDINEDTDFLYMLPERIADSDGRDFKSKNFYIEIGQISPNTQNMEDLPLKETELKVSEEIYNTLKTMSEFLTQPEKEITLGPDEEANIISEQTDKEKIHDIIKTSKVIQVGDSIYHDASMQQNSIDALLLSHFGETKPKFKHANELKEQIEKQIKKIKFYK